MKLKQKIYNFYLNNDNKKLINGNRIKKKKKSYLIVLQYILAFLFIFLSLSITFIILYNNSKLLFYLKYIRITNKINNMIKYIFGIFNSNNLSSKVNKTINRLFWNNTKITIFF